MQVLYRKRPPVFIFLILSLLTLKPASSQTLTADTVPKGAQKTVVAGSHYASSAIRKKIWGEHYRKEWTTPVTVSVLHLDTVFGGLMPVEKGGGNQTKNLRLKRSDGKEYVLRSVDKNFQPNIPEIANGSFVEDIVNDQVSTAHPYAALTIPAMAQAAGIYHTYPQIVFVPKTSSLGEFAEEFGDQLYLFEERPDDDQSDAPHFGNSADVISTEKMMQMVTANNSHYVDQAFFVRCRLFDMFIGDWGRHEDQWRWATFTVNNDTGRKFYRPIPRDRDQAYTLFDGLLVGLLKSSVQYGLESFGEDIKSTAKYNFPARFLDRRFTNNVSLGTWVSIAEDLKTRLTNQVIEDAVKNFPPEVYGISGEIIAKKLKSRRDNLDKYAREYYSFLTKVVDVTGSLEKERFEVSYQGGDTVIVNIFRVDANDQPGALIYSRAFLESETKEIRLYGLDGNDQFITNGDGNTGIKIRMVGGPQEDRYETAAGKKGIPVRVYDNRQNAFALLRNGKLKLSSDSAVHRYEYNAFQYNRRGLKKAISYNNKDRIFIRTGYYIQRSHFRKQPYGYRQDLNLNYSIWQNSFSTQYKALFVRAIGNWNIALDGEYDAVRDFHYPGVGNETKIDLTIRNFYRVRTREYHFNAGLTKDIGKFQTIGFYGYYQGFKLLYDKLKFLSQYPAEDPLYATRDYVGALASHSFLRLNDPVVPTKGFGFSSDVAYTKPLDAGKKPFFRYSGNFGFYLPLLGNLALASRTGYSTLSENTDFNQLNRLGGGATFRGYLRFRFYGKTSLLNSNELQWTKDVRSYIMNGKIGLVGFFDNGRVWQPGEISNTWHISYGGGLLLAPFNKIVAVGTYGFTKEGNRINFRLGRLF